MLLGLSEVWLGSVLKVLDMIVSVMGNIASSYLDTKPEVTWHLYHLLGLDILQHSPVDMAAQRALQLRICNLITHNFSLLHGGVINKSNDTNR